MDATGSASEAISQWAAKAVGQDHHNSKKNTPHAVYRALGIAQEASTDETKLEGGKGKDPLKIKGAGGTSDSGALSSVNQEQASGGLSMTATPSIVKLQGEVEKSEDWFQLASHLSSVRLFMRIAFFPEGIR